MKYEKTKAQQARKNDGYKKGAKREAAKMSRRHGKKSGKQMLHEMPVAHLTAAKQRELLLELVESFREGFEFGTADDIYRGCVSTFEKYDVDVQPDSETH